MVTQKEVKLQGGIFLPLEYAAKVGMEDAANGVKFEERFTFLKELGECYTLGYLLN